MEHILDKCIVLILCSVVAALAGITTPVVVGCLVAVSLTALFELATLPKWVHIADPLLFCLLALFVPDFLLFLPFAAADLFRLRLSPLRFVWLIPLFVVFVMPQQLTLDILYLYIATLVCVLACVFSWRSNRMESHVRAFRAHRDELTQTSYKLELRNRALSEGQELELRFATLNERSRIAREIHDNVGHLLTRSVLQVEALAVVRADDEKLTNELTQVGDTLATAFDAVRTSVHGLHEEAYNLKTHLSALAQMESVEMQVDYRAENLPPQVAYSFLAIVREALSNSKRHSDATEIGVAVVEFPGLYQLTVHDNGSRLPGKEGNDMRGGIGLASMEERARILGGIFRTSFDKGFKIFVSVPKTETEPECVS